MVLIHDAIRRDLPRFATAIEKADPSRDWHFRNLAEWYVKYFQTSVHTHHGEMNQFKPLLHC